MRASRLWLSACRVQWRYDTINRLLIENYGHIDHDVAKHIITFLSPDRTPGYWTNTWNASDPMSAIVEGHLVVADVKVSRTARRRGPVVCSCRSRVPAIVYGSQTGMFQVKGGYWADEWLQVQLPNYV